MFAVPLPYVPYAFGLAALAITAAVIPALYGFMQNALQMPRPASISCAIAIGIVPAGDWIMMANVDDSIWAIAATLILCLWNPLPDHMLGKIGYFCWRAISIATNPIALPAICVWAVFLIRAKRRGDRWIWGLLIGTGLAYAVFGIDHHPGAFSAPALVAAQALRLATQSSLLALIPGANFLGGWPDLSVLTIIFALAVAALAAIRKRPGEMVVFCLGLGVMCTICALGRGVQHEPSYLIYTARYAYVERLLWCCLIAAALYDLWTRHETPPVRLAIVAGSALLIAVQLVGRASSYAWDEVATSDRLLAFLAESDRKLKAGAPGPFTLVRTDQYGDWSITVGGTGHSQ